MNSWIIVVVFIACFGSSSVFAVEDEYAAFFEAFPNANRTAFYEYLPVILSKQRPVEYVAPQGFAACPSIPTPPDATNVNNLRPGNIKVVMAMGDSITAAMSAKDTLIFSLKEYRGIAYSIGGDSGVTTLPNILKQYSPNLIGSSTGIGKREISTNGLNAAVSGAINSDMLGQAQWLVQQLKANTKINYNNDWKLLTVWIGSNNLCDVCDNVNNNNGANFQTQLTNALEYLYANVPRVFVNLVANLEISGLANVNSGACSLIHSIACGCVGGSANDRAIVASNGKDYQARAYPIAQAFNARNNPGFAVVVQPFLLNTTINLRSELSAADCFHPSAPSHVYAAVALWNNLISPASRKQLSWDINGTPICPNSDTLLYTN